MFDGHGVAAEDHGRRQHVHRDFGVYAVDGGGADDGPAGLMARDHAQPVHRSHGLVFADILHAHVAGGIQPQFGGLLLALVDGIFALANGMKTEITGNNNDLRMMNDEKTG